MHALNYLLFTVYLIIFCWLVPRVSFVKRSGISSKTILALFLLKIMAGIAIGWLSLHYYNTANDYWDVNREGWKEYQLLLSDPGEYFSNIFRSGYAQGYGGFFNSFGSFWNDLRNNLIIKLVSVFDIFSQGNYYINSLFFNFLILFGHVALYRVFINIYRNNTWPCIVGCFLLPSTLYFGSGIHRDGIVFLMLALLLYCIYFSLLQNRFSSKRILAIIFAAAIILLTRSFIFIALVPAVIAWVLAQKMKWSTWGTFVVVYLLAGIVLFNLHSLLPSADPLATIVQKQSDYKALQHSATDIKPDSLSPHFKSFLYNAPRSLDHVLLRPYLFELPSRILLPMNIELFGYQLMFLTFLFFRQRIGKTATDPFIYFAVFFTLTVFLFIGYIVPNLGTLVRYRSLYFPLIITAVLCRLDWERMRKLFQSKK